MNFNSYQLFRSLIFKNYVVLWEFPWWIPGFWDAEREIYMDINEKVVPNLVPGGILAADNVINHADTLADFIAQAEDDPRVDALVVPVGKGILVCRKM